MEPEKRAGGDRWTQRGRKKQLRQVETAGRGQDSSGEGRGRHGKQRGEWRPAACGAQDLGHRPDPPGQPPYSPIFLRTLLGIWIFLDASCSPHAAWGAGKGWAV